MVQHLLTKEMVEDFNKVLEQEDSILKVDFEGTCGYIKFVSDRFNKNTCTPHVSDEFYVVLNSFLKKQYNLNEVNYNNTKSTFWIIG